MKSKLPKDNEVIDISKKLNLVINSDALFILKETGPYLYKYKEQINEKNMTYFINKDDWSDDINTEANINDSQLSHNIINKVKEIWIKLKDNEKNIIYSITESLLLDYCNYLLKINK
jgi:GTPase involved in cell partitioning and DNA repair